MRLSAFSGNRSTTKTFWTSCLSILFNNAQGTPVMSTSDEIVAGHVQKHRRTVWHMIELKMPNASGIRCRDWWYGPHGKCCGGYPHPALQTSPRQSARVTTEGGVEYTSPRPYLSPMYVHMQVSFRDSRPAALDSRSLKQSPPHSGNTGESNRVHWVAEHTYRY